MFNFEHGLVVYTAGPIDMNNGDVIQKDWRSLLQDALKSCGGMKVITFDPSKPFWLNDGHQLNDYHDRSFKFIETVNLAALSCSDIVIVAHSSKVGSMGTPIEMEIANRLSIPMFVFSDLPAGKSVYLDNRAYVHTTVDWGNKENVVGAFNAVAALIAKDEVVKSDTFGAYHEIGPEGHSEVLYDALLLMTDKMIRSDKPYRYTGK